MLLNIFKLIVHRYGLMRIILVLIVSGLSSSLAAENLRRDFLWDKVTVQCGKNPVFTVEYRGGNYRIPLSPRTASKDCWVTVDWVMKRQFQNTSYGRAVMRMISNRQNVKSHTSDGVRNGTPSLKRPWVATTKANLGRIASKSFGFTLQYNADTQVTADSTYRRFVRIRETLSAPNSVGLPRMPPKRALIDHVISGKEIIDYTRSLGYEVKIQGPAGTTRPDGLCEFILPVNYMNIAYPGTQDTCTFDLFDSGISLNAPWSYVNAKIAGNARYKQILSQPRRGEKRLQLKVVIKSGRRPMRSLLSGEQKAQLVHVILRGPSGSNWRTAISRR